MDSTKENRPQRPKPHTQQKFEDAFIPLLWLVICATFIFPSLYAHDLTELPTQGTDAKSTGDVVLSGGFEWRLLCIFAVLFFTMPWFLYLKSVRIFLERGLPRRLIYILIVLLSICPIGAWALGPDSHGGTWGGDAWLSSAMYYMTVLSGLSFVKLALSVFYR
ncbi:hypothetical protein MMC28_003146 [Mycoblastus sanguinarius]|nr:hypothetical protein [Mycoblastus sanguinarius]